MPLKMLQPVFLASRLCRNFSHDSVLLLCSNLLCLFLQSSHKDILLDHNNCVWSPGHYHPSCPFTFFPSLATLQSLFISLHGIFRCHSCSSCSGHQLGAPTGCCCTRIRASNGHSIWHWSCVLCY